MTRTAWILTIAVVAVAAVAGSVGIVAIATDDNGKVADGSRALLNGQGQLDGPWGHSDNNGQGLPFGDGDGSGPRGRMASLQESDGWSPLFGLPWLAAGLLLGLGATMLAWQPWKRPALATVAAGAASEEAVSAAAQDAGAFNVSQQWAQWHRDVHAADETTREMTASAVAADAPAATEPAGEVEPAAETATVVEAETVAEAGTEAAKSTDEEIQV